MSVHYKFKSALNSDTVTFDGLHISVGDLKKAIIHQKRLGKTVDFDLQITNAQTKEEYSDNNTLIPKNTSLIVARIPLAVQPKKQWDIQAEKQQQQQAHRHNNAPEPDGGALDLSQMNGTEEDKIQAMMIQSTMDYDPNNYQVIRGQSQVGEVPANYRCFKCRKPGHWIKNCPLSSNGEVNDYKRNTGIPRSFIERDANDKNSPANVEPVPPPVVEKKQEIPEDLICGICKDLFLDAVMIPCCGSSFCDECVRTALLESEDNECPDCKEKGSSPGSLIPNRFLRNSVNAFKNETGYAKPRPPKPPPKPKEVENSVSVVEESAERKGETEAEVEKLPETKPAEKEPEEKPVSKPATTTPTDAASKEKREKKEETTEAHDKKADPGHQSSHDEIESDFEDNITVTVPAAHLISHQRSDYRDRPYNGRHSRHLRPPGMEGSPKHSSQHTPSRGDRSGASPVGDEKESGHHDHHKHHHQIPSHQAPHRGDQMRPHRSTPSDMYGPGAPITSYPPVQGPMMGPGRPYEMGGYGPPPGPGFPPYMMDNRMRGPFHPIRPGFPQPHQMRPRMMAPPGSLASVYHGVAAKVGPGIIDDPLEAFNRIMREKEKRKEERRRGPGDNRRRSRSIEMNMARGRGHSPPPHHVRPQRMRTPEDRRMRSPQMRDRRGRSREKRSVDKEKRRHRSSSFSDKSRSRSRSRSWSNPPRKRSKSPGMRRRTRSRSPSFAMGRFRQKENRRPDRRDDFPPREEFRDRSPGNYQQRRGRSPRRGQSPPPQHNQFYGRPDRQGHCGPPPDQYFNMPPGSSGSYNEGPPYGQNNSGNNRYHDRMPPHREQYGRDRNMDYKMDRFDDGPPGNDEPPPPGFETSPPPPRERHNSWNNNPFDDRDRGGGNYRQDMRKEQMNRNRGHTPIEMREKHSPMRDREDMRHHEVVGIGRDREGRSWSRASRQSPMNHGRRRSRSKSLPRIERMVDEYPVSDRGKERQHGSRDRPGYDRDRDKLEHDKKREREREEKERDRKHAEREKKEHERKQHEKDSRRAAREEKDREKEKERDRDREKEQEKSREKKRDSSDDEKKDKKSKEKRKKKKEKEAERKRNKKDKKERKEREKERDKEKEKERDIGKKDASRESKTDESFESIDSNQNENRELGNEVELMNPPAQISEAPSGREETDSNLEEGEINDNEEDTTSAKTKQQQHEIEIIDLYGDICQDEEIKYDYSNSVSASNADTEKSHSHSQEHRRSSPPEFKRFDSVLDIHANLDFEPDIEEIELIEPKKEGNPFNPLMPEPSKWEREDEVTLSKEETVESKSPEMIDDKTGKVTTEVLKRAENAIFARAINAIRPIEIKKISVERQKLYSNDPMKDLAMAASVMGQMKSPNCDLATVQITVPANSNSERSVEIKPEKQKSIKDRLGSKIPEPPLRRHRSKSQSPVRKSAVERLRPTQSKSRERDAGSRRDEREVRRTSEVKKMQEPPASRSRERAQPEVSRGRDQGRGSERSEKTDRPERSERLDRPEKSERTNRSERSERQDRPDRQDRSDRVDRPERSERQERPDRSERQDRGDRPERLDRFDRGDRQDRRREFGQDRNADNRNDRSDRGRTWEQDRLRVDKNRGRGETNRERDRGDGDWSRSSDKSRDRQNPKDERKGGSRVDELRGKDRAKSRDRDRERPSEAKRGHSGSQSSDRNRDKIARGDRDPKRKHDDDRVWPSTEKRSKQDRSKEDEKANSRSTRDKTLQRKKSNIDEVNPTLDKSEPVDKSGPNTLDPAAPERSTDKTKTPDEGGVRSGSAPKRSRSPSESSSSSSSSSSESETESDEGKKKKRSKHKKNKKKSRRSSSLESGGSSGKHKRGKSKKKNKNAKKKKKSKK